MDKKALHDLYYVSGKQVKKLKSDPKVPANEIDAVCNPKDIGDGWHYKLNNSDVNQLIEIAGYDAVVEALIQNSSRPVP